MKAPDEICFMCGHDELVEEELFKAYKESPDSKETILEVVQIELTCKKCYFSRYLIDINDENISTH